MKQKLLDNKNIIILIASIVACALLAPTFISFFGDTINDRSIVSIIMYAAYAAANLIIIIFVISKKELSLLTLMIPLIVFESAGLLNNIYSLIKNNSWVGLYYCALYFSIILCYIIYYFNRNEKLRIAILILFLICIAFNVVGVFGGSNISLCVLITNLLLTGIFYSITSGGESL
jgi:hypothetical protein